MCVAARCSVMQRVAVSYSVMQHAAAWYIEYYEYTCREFEMAHTYIRECVCVYGVAANIRLLKTVGLFCKRALQKRRYFAKETYNFKEPTNLSHPIPVYRRSTYN